jgi:hypothetical protein
LSSQRRVDDYANVSVIELEWALIEGLARVGEIGMEQTREEIESVVQEKRNNVLWVFQNTENSIIVAECTG